MTVTNLLVENLTHIMNPKVTACMEEDLDKIANGEVDRNKILRKFYTQFK